MTEMMYGSKKVTLHGEPKGGWQTVILPDGSEKKVRPKELSEITGNVVHANLEEYEKAEGKSGRKTVDTGDDVAVRLRDCKTLDEMYKMMSSYFTKAEVDEAKEKWAHLNHGMQRMNIGNRIRGAIRRADKEEAEAPKEKKAKKG